MIAAFEQSGERLDRFCAQRRIPPATLRWWRWHLRDARPAPSRKAPEEVRLVPVEVVGLSAGMPGARSVVITVSNVDVRVEVGLLEVAVHLELASRLSAESGSSTPSTVISSSSSADGSTA